MERRHNWLIWAAWVAIMVGCNKGGSGTTETGDTRSSTPAQTKPEKVVFNFLDAVRKGDDTKAGELLTPTARKKTAEKDMVVAPPGSSTAKFKVGEVELIGDDGAHVASTWTDVDSDGSPYTTTYIWVLRLEDEGWRIAGMATRIFEDEDPLILNFEDPEDMLRKQQLADEEMARRSGESLEAKADTLEAKKVPVRDPQRKSR